MMNTWTPSKGLQQADAVVKEIEQAYEATTPGPVRRHRLMEIVAKAIDGDPEQVSALPNGTVFANGRVEDSVYIQVPPKHVPVAGTHPVAVAAPVLESVQVSAPSSPADTLRAKKRRGRPKGSTKKAKPDAAATAE